MSKHGIRPIFITGGMRTGTTLMSRILNNHSHLNVTYDSVHFMRFCIDQFDPLDNEENYAALLEEIKGRVEHRMGREFDITPLRQRFRQTADLSYAHIYHEIMANLLLEDPHNRWGEKTMMCWTKIPRFLEMFPEGNVIHLIRDPRDVVASLRKVTTEPGLRYLDPFFSHLHSMRWARTGRSQYKPHRYMVLRYEDLVSQPVETIKNVCRLLEIPFEAQMLNSQNFVDRTGAPWRGNSSYNNRWDSINASSIGKYKEELTKEEIFLAEMVCRHEMEAFGYSLNGNWLTKAEWDSLYTILSDDFIHSRFIQWLETNQGVEAYPSSPPKT